VHVTLVAGINPEGSAASGTRNYVLGLAERLPRHDISVSLVARDGAVALPGVSYTRISSGSSSARFLLRLMASAGAPPIPRDSIIHAQRPDDLVAFTFAKRKNPKVCTLYGIPAIAVPRRKGSGYGAAYRALERIGLRRADRILAVDEQTAQWYMDRYPRLARRIEIVPVAIDLARFRLMNRDAARAKYRVTAKYVALFAGRLTVEKRVWAVIRAMREVSDAELLVAGEGPERDSLAAEATGGRVRFLGAIPHVEMPGLLNAADVLALPSEYEGLPTVALEALACGVPVVATPVGGVPSVVTEGKTGWFVRDLTMLPATLRTAFPAAEGMRDACMAAAKPYGWDTVIERIIAAYRGAEAGS